MFYICFLAPHFPTFIGTDFSFEPTGEDKQISVVPSESQMN